MQDMKKTIARATVSGCLKAPPSKSYAQRAIAAGLLGSGLTTLTNMELCSDTRAAMETARMLGAQISHTGGDTYIIRGGLNPVGSVLDIGESGLSARMFIPIASLCGSHVTIIGGGSIVRRPMDMIVQPLRNLGVEVADTHGRLPITVRGPIRGGDIVVDGSVSSQFVTGLLMALPMAAGETTFRVSEPVSIPYIDMTLDVLERFGIEVEHQDYGHFYVKGSQRYTPCEYRVEGDWSGASCILVAGAIAGAVAGEITVGNLDPLSKQADAAIIDALSLSGAEVATDGRKVTVRRPERLYGFRFDASHCPDLFPALTALAANCEGDTLIAGVRRLTHKESDRAAALCTEFGKMGIAIDLPEPDVMRIRGGRPHGADVDSHGDHRIAMSCAAAALCADAPVTIEGAESVEKSYPAFWNDLAAITL